MKQSIYPLGLIFGLNERLFVNALEGVSEEVAAERVSDHNNSLLWISTHTVWARYNMLYFLGRPVSNPYQSLFENFKPYSVDDHYPTLEAVKVEWKKVGTLLNEAMENVTEEHLQAETAVKFPIADSTNGGSIGFFAQHESYDIGQMAFLKKFHTNEAMKY